jgi:hypothetical protein
MIRNLAIFAGCFGIGALIALVVRTAVHDPHVPPPAAPAVDPKPVNTVCAICSMQIQPGAGTAVYKGKTIAFGCAGCKPKFLQDPDKFGPAFLENRVVE